MYKGVKVSKEQIDTEVTAESVGYLLHYYHIPIFMRCILLQIESLAKGRAVSFKKRKFSSMRGAGKDDTESGSKNNAVSAESKDS